jgi:hypothetical protein
LRVAHHPGAFRRDVIYHITVDKEAADKAPQRSVEVETRLPGGVALEEAYFYEEVPHWTVRELLSL